MATSKAVSSNDALIAAEKTIMAVQIIDPCICSEMLEYYTALGRSDLAQGVSQSVLQMYKDGDAKV